MKAKRLSNGQIEVKHENLTLTHSDIKGNKFNDCEIDKGEYYLTVKNSDERFKPLFIALVNFKNSEK
jgi:hypothetical protein